MLEHAVFKPKVPRMAQGDEKGELRDRPCDAEPRRRRPGADDLDVLLESCPTKILLPNEEATRATRSPRARAASTRMQIGLNPRQIELLATATKKRHYYYLSTEGRRLFDLNLGPVTLAFVGASGKEDFAAIRELEGLHAGQRLAGGAWLRARRPASPGGV